MLIRNNLRLKRTTTTLSCFLASLTPTVYAGELVLKPNVAASTYYYQTEIGTQPASSNQAAVLEPSIIASFDSQKLKSSVYVKHTSIAQTGDSESSTNSYNDIKVDANLSVIDKFLSVGASVGQNYRAASESQALVSDKLLNSGNLAKSQQSSANVSLQSPNPQYIGYAFNGSRSETKTNRTTDNLLSDLNNSVTSLTGRLYQGRALENIAWDVQYQQTQTDRTNLIDVESSMLNGRVSFGLFSKIRFLMVGNEERNTIDTTSEGTLPRNTGLDTTSYGAGLEWFEKDNRSIALTFNRLEEDVNVTNYVGLQANWAFTSRTSVQLDLGKRFYGDSVSFSFNHATKHLRTKFKYSEDVTSFAQQTQGLESLGVFVCEIGNTEFSSCFQPDSLQYELQPGEQFVSFSQSVFDITERVFFRKGGTLNLGYTNKKFKIDLVYDHSDIDYLESDVQRTTERVNLKVSYQLRKNSSVNVGIINTARSSNEFARDNTLNLTAGYNNKLSERLDVGVAFRYLFRNANVDASDFKDSRATVSLRYAF